MISNLDCSANTIYFYNRADAKANAAMMEPPPPRPIIDMGRGMEPHMENGKLPYAAHQENYHQQQVHKVYLLLHSFSFYLFAH